MQVFLLNANSSWGQTMETVIDRSFHEDRFEIHPAVSPDDLASMVGLLNYDAILVVADKEDPQTLKALGVLRGRERKGPIIALYNAGQPAALFNIVSSDAVIPLAWHAQHVDPEFLCKAVENIIRATRHESDLLDCGVFQIDRAARLVTANGIALNFTGSEYDLLEYLVSGKGVVRSKEGIILSLYGSSDEAPDEKIVDVFVCKVRDKLNAAQTGLGDCIQTIWGQGYKFVRDPSADQKYARRFGPLEIDYTGQQASIDGKRLDLTITEFMILKALAFAYPKAVPMEVLVTEANKFGRQGDHDTVDRALSSMRRTLEETHPAFRKPFLRNDQNDIFMNVLRIDPQAARKIQYEIVTLGPLRINRTTDDVMLAGHDVNLTKGEYRILNALVDAYPNVQSAADIINSLGDSITLSSFNVTLAGLRDKLAGANEGRPVISSKRGVGYSFTFEDKKLDRQFEDRLSTFDCGPFRIDYNRKRILVHHPDNNREWAVLDLSAAQIGMVTKLLESYPFSVQGNELMADKGLDGSERADSIFVQLKTRLSYQIGHIANAGLRKTDGMYRIDLDPDDMPEPVRHACTITNVGPWTVNHTARFVLFDGDPVGVNDSEFLLLETLVRRFPEPCDKTELAELLYDGHQGSFAACLMNLKKKLRERHGITEKIFHTVRGFGVALNVDRNELDDEQINALPVSAIAAGVDIDHAMRRLVVGGQTLDLSAAEYFCLNILANADRPYTPQALSDLSQQQGHAWGPQALYFALTVSLQQKLNTLAVPMECVIAPDRRAGFYMMDRAEIIRAHDAVVSAGRLTLNVTQRTLSITQTNIKKPPVVISLSPAEVKFLKPLLQHPGAILSAEELATLDGDAAASTLKVARSTIERKLLDSGSDFSNIIDIVYKTGYFVRSCPKQADPPARLPVRDTTPRDAVTLEAGPLTLNTVLETAVYDGVRLGYVKGVPFDILALLVQSQDHHLTHDNLARHFFGGRVDQRSHEQIQRALVSLRHMIDKSMPRLADILIMDDGDGKGIRLYTGDPYERFMALVNESQQRAAPIVPASGKQKTGQSPPQAQPVFNSFADLGRAMGLEPCAAAPDQDLSHAGAAVTADRFETVP